MKAYACDIAVVGAGSAGIAAAFAAARRGASVCVIERSTTVGGNATDAIVGTICGLSLCGPASASRQLPQYDNPGFASDFGRRVASASGTMLVRNDLQLTYLPYRVDAFEHVARKTLESIDSISLHLSTKLVSLERAGERGDFLLCVSKHSDSTTEIRAQAVVDGSGDAIVSSYLKLSTMSPNPPQAAALVFELSGLPSLDERTLGFTMRKILREASTEGALAEHNSYLSLVPGSFQGGRVLCKLGVAPLCESAAEAPLDAIYTKTMDSIPEILKCLCERSPLFCATQHTRTAPKLGVRSGRRGVGKLLLEDDAVLFSKPDPSGVALGFWPVETWDTPLRPEMVFPQGCGAYEIPFGSLCAKEIPGVYFAGRTISASDKAIASARVIGTCLSTGYAAGSIAAGTIQGEPRPSLISSLREEQVSPFYESRLA